MSPGDTVDIIINIEAKSKEEGIIIDGTGLSGEVNRTMKDINSKYLTRENYASYSINKADQIDSLMMWKNNQVARLDSMVMKMNAGLPELADCSPLASDIIRTSILTWYAMILLDSYDNYLQDDYDRDAYWRNYFDFLADFLMVIGTVYIRNEHYMKAALQFIKATQTEKFFTLGTNSFRAYYHLGAVYEMIGQPENALLFYEKCGAYDLAQERIKFLKESQK